MNETFVETTGAGVFVTMIVMLVDPAGRRIHYIRAGHNPPLSVNPSGGGRLIECGGGPPIGLFPGLQYSREIRDIEPGSVIVLYTDGVSEAEDANDDQFGTDRLMSVVTKERFSPARRIHASIRSALKEFAGDEPTHDDSTLVVLKFG